MRHYLLFCFCLLTAVSVRAQQCGFTPDFVLIGNASDSVSGCYQLTDSGVTSAKNAIWNRTTISLRYDFDFSFISTQCGTADGYVFVLHQAGPNVNPGGTAGGALNYFNTFNIGNSIGVEVDIYDNGFAFNDPDSSHIAIVGNSNPTPLVGPKSIQPYLGLCIPHVIRFRWKALEHRFTVFWDGDSLMSLTEDLVATRFRNNPEVTFGFTASTGAETSDQLLCPAEMYYDGARQVRILADGPLRFCLPDSVGLRAVTGLDSATAYAWTPSLGLNRDTGRNVTASPLNPTQYKVVVTYPGGCTSADSILITASPTPVVDLPDTVYVCSETSGVQITAAAQQDGVRFRWSPRDYVSSDTARVNTLFPRINGIQFNVTATSAAGCIAKDSAIGKIRNTLNVSLGPDLTFCPGDSVRLPVPDVGPGATYEWTPDVGNDTNVVVRPSAPVRYSLTVIDSGGCFGRTSVLVSPAVDPAPRFDIKADGDAGTFDGSITFTATEPNSHVSWNFGDGSPVDTNHTVHHTYKPGKYEVTVTYTFGPGCSSTSRFQYQSNLIPNIITPNNDGDNDTFAPILGGDYKVEIYNRWGKQMLKAANYKGDWGTSDVAAGTYFYRISTASGKTYKGWLEVIK